MKLIFSCIIGDWLLKVEKCTVGRSNVNLPVKESVQMDDESSSAPFEQ